MLEVEDVEETLCFRRIDRRDAACCFWCSYSEAAIAAPDRLKIDETVTYCAVGGCWFLYGCRVSVSSPWGSSSEGFFTSTSCDMDGRGVAIEVGLVTSRPLFFSESSAKLAAFVFCRLCLDEVEVEVFVGVEGDVLTLLPSSNPRRSWIGVPRRCCCCGEEEEATDNCSSSLRSSGFRSKLDGRRFESLYLSAGEVVEEEEEENVDIDEGVDGEDGVASSIGEIIPLIPPPCCADADGDMLFLTRLLCEKTPRCCPPQKRE